MATRNNLIIRRDINRLNDLIAARGAKVPALQAIADVISPAAQKVNTAWQTFQAASVSGDKEREERDTAIGELVKWIQLWRPVVLIRVPGAESNLKILPASGATPDDVIRVAEDMQEFINSNPSTESIREITGSSLSALLESAKKENNEAVDALPMENQCMANFSEACTAANTVLVPGLNIVRTAFGPTSREYKQFIARNSGNDDDEDKDEEGQTYY